MRRLLSINIKIEKNNNHNNNNYYYNNNNHKCIMYKYRIKIN